MLAASTCPALADVVDAWMDGPDGDLFVIDVEDKMLNARAPGVDRIPLAGGRLLDDLITRTSTLQHVGVFRLRGLSGYL